jgi:hypothetical protein
MHYRSLRNSPNTPAQLKPVGVGMNEVLQSLDSDGSDYTEFIAATLDR